MSSVAAPACLYGGAAPELSLRAAATGAITSSPTGGEGRGVPAALPGSLRQRVYPAFSKRVSMPRCAAPRRAVSCCRQVHSGRPASRAESVLYYGIEAAAALVVTL